MKVVHISYSDYEGAGGTSVALGRLHSGLKKKNIDSKILCARGPRHSDEIFSVGGPRLLQALTKRLLAPTSLNYVHIVGSFSLPKLRIIKEADVLHFHSLHSGFFNYLALPRFRHKPAVWTLHDVWPITGHCSINYDCQRWKTGCGKCPYPDTFPAVKRDVTATEWKLKNWAYKRSSFEVVTASKWFQSMVKESMLGYRRMTLIPWGVDETVYRPLNKKESRSVLGLPPDKKVILFAVANAKHTSKGADLLLKALTSLPEAIKKECVLLTLGEDHDQVFLDIGMPVHHLGFVTSDHFKAIVYSAADVFVSPTRAETFGITIIESMACGTPVVSFDIGPIAERVKNGVTGYAARPEDAEDLAKGMRDILQNDALREEMGRRSRDLILADYTSTHEVERYSLLYRDVIARHAAEK